MTVNNSLRQCVLPLVWVLLLLQPAILTLAETTPSDTISVVKHKAGKAADAAWVFHLQQIPEGPRPVVIFMHGYRALDPYDYGGWIDHLARRGNIVIYPIYEKTRRDGREQLLKQATAGIHNALDYIKAQNMPIDTAHIATVGHSLGGGMTVLLATRGPQLNLPLLCAAMPVQPGSKGGQGFHYEVFAELPHSLKVLVVDGDSDQFKDSRFGVHIIPEASQVSAINKAYFILQSSKDSTPPLLADHYAPLSPDANYRLEPRSRWKKRREKFVKKIMSIRDGEVDALDTRALWPMFDTLLEQACNSSQGLTPILHSDRIDWRLLQKK